MTSSSHSKPGAQSTPLWLPVLVLFFGIFATSFAAIFVRICEVELGPCGTIFNRFWIATVPLGFWLGYKQIRSPEPFFAHQIQRQDWLLLGLAGLVAAIDLPLLAYALSQTSVANATVLSDLSPFFTTLGAWLILKQLFDRRFLVGLSLSLVGVAAIAISDFQLEPGQLWGDTVALVSAVSLSAYLLTIEQLRVRLSTTTILFWTSAIAALLTAGCALVLEGGHLFPSSSAGWWAAVGLGLVSQAIGQGLIAFSLNKVSAGLAALMFLLEPVMSATGAWFLFAEALSVLNAIAFTLVLFGIYIAISSPSAVKEAASA